MKRQAASLEVDLTASDDMSSPRHEVSKASKKRARHAAETGRPHRPASRPLVLDLSRESSREEQPVDLTASPAASPPARVGPQRHPVHPAQSAHEGPAHQQTLRQGWDGRGSDSWEAKALAAAAEAGVAEVQADEELARRMQQEEERAAAERLQQRMDQLERQEAQAASAGLLGRSFGPSWRPSMAAAAAGTAAADRAAGHDPFAAAYPTGPRSGNRRRSGNRWGGLPPLGGLLQPFGLFGGGHGLFGGDHHLPPHLAAIHQAMVGGAASGLPPSLLFSDRDFTEHDYETLLRLDDKVQKRGASKAAVDALETFIAPHSSSSSERLDACSICLENPRPGDQLCSLPCKHCYHKHCIHRWLLGSKNSCPICARPAV